MKIFYEWKHQLLYYTIHSLRWIIMENGPFQLFSIYDLYLWNGIQPEVGKQVLRISHLEPAAAKLIGVEAGQAVMEFSCVTQDTTGRIIEFARNYIRGDKTEFTVHYTNQ